MAWVTANGIVVTGLRIEACAGCVLCGWEGGGTCRRGWKEPNLEGQVYDPEKSSLFSTTKHNGAVVRLAHLEVIPPRLGSCPGPEVVIPSV